MRHSAIVIIAVLLGGLVAYATASSCNVASAQTLPPSEDVLNEAKVRELRYFLDKPNSADQLTRSRWRNILGRAIPKAAPRVSPWMVKGGLATAAAGIWWHNGNMLYEHYTSSGATKVAAYEMDFAAHPNAAVYRGYNGSGGTAGEGMVVFVTRLDWSVASGVGTYDIDAIRGVTKWNCGSTVCEAFAGSLALQRNGAGWATKNFGITGANKTEVDAGKYEYPREVEWKANLSYQLSTSQYRFMYGDGAQGGVTPPLKKLGPDPLCVTNGCTQVADFPVFEVGANKQLSPEYVPGSGDFIMTPQEGDALYDQIKADPEYKPTTDDPPPDEDWEKQHERRIGELTPTHGPEEWTRNNPDGSRTTRFRDGTELTTSPDKTEMLRRPDGTKEYTYPDGTTRRVTPDGTERTTWPDGTTRTRREGQEDNWTNPDGTTRTAPTPQEQTENYPEPSTKPNPGPGDSGTTNQGPDGCASPRAMTFDLPEIPLQDHFPFSLILKAWDWMGMLVSTPAAPSFNLPLFGTISPPPALDSLASAVRAVIGVVVAIGMSFWFYRYITGKGSDG